MRPVLHKAPARRAAVEAGAFGQGRPEPGVVGAPAKRWPAFYAGLVGAWLGLALLKFGNPVILDHLVEPPRDVYEGIFVAWPVKWGYLIGGLVALAGLSLARVERSRLHWLVWLPAAWLGWQFLAATQTVDARLTGAVLKHFTTCVAGFYLGLFALSRVRRLEPFWAMILAAMLWVLWTGLEQHFGGLEATRQHVRAQPNFPQMPPAYLKKLESDRIFSTLVYPNALAGALLLLTPVCLLTTWRLSARLATATRAVLVGSVAAAASGCLYWSGSKAGWLIALGLLTVVLLRLKLARTVKLGVVGVVLVAGLAAFSLKFAAYFQTGATSVGARFDYWRAAWEVALTKPVFGSGPGTFAIPYAERRARMMEPSEMTRLVHNDYLEQASDSGVVGFLTFTVFVLGSVGVLGRTTGGDGRRLAVWLGLLGWALQSFVEFGLYLPALAWPAFVLLGWLWGTRGGGPPATGLTSSQQIPIARIPSTPRRGSPTFPPAR